MRVCRLTTDPTVDWRHQYLDLRWWGGKTRPRRLVLTVGEEEAIPILNIEEHQESKSFLWVFLTTICLNRKSLHVRLKFTSQGLLCYLLGNVPNEDLHIVWEAQLKGSSTERIFEEKVLATDLIPRAFRGRRCEDVCLRWCLS